MNYEAPVMESRDESFQERVVQSRDGSYHQYQQREIERRQFYTQHHQHSTPRDHTPERQHKPAAPSKPDSL